MYRPDFKQQNLNRKLLICKKTLKNEDMCLGTEQFILIGRQF